MRFFDFNPEKPHDEMNGIFIAHEQIGVRIPKNKENKAINNENIDVDNEKGLYKKVSYQLRDGFCFRFFADIDIDLKKEKLPEFIKMGASQSWFKLQVTQADSGATLSFQKLVGSSHFGYPNSQQAKIVLLSDSLVEYSILKQLNFSLSDVNTITYLETHNNIEKRYKNQRAGFSMEKSKTFFDLLKRGSVLFVGHETKKEILEKIESQSAFRLVGYNYAI
jgi:hypothetical protein